MDVFRVFWAKTVQKKPGERSEPKIFTFFGLFFFLKNVQITSRVRRFEYFSEKRDTFFEKLCWPTTFWKMCSLTTLFFKNLIFFFWVSLPTPTWGEFREQLALLILFPDHPQGPARLAQRLGQTPYNQAPIAGMPPTHRHHIVTYRRAPYFPA